MEHHLKERRKTMPKILLIGPRQNKYDLSDTGGITVLFELLISEFKKKNISFQIIDTLVANNGGKLKTLFFTYYQILKKIRKVEHLSLHGAENSFLLIAPILLILAKIYNKTVSIRLFAGDFGDKYKQANPIKKYMTRLILKHADTLFFELKHLVTEFKQYNPNTYWFPNVRDEEIQQIKDRSFQKKFVYIGSINKEKGIDELCAAIKKLDKEITVDLYGPIKYKSEKYSLEYFQKLGINYKGALKTDEVQKVMDLYDILILPSHREGYPGVIIEAYALSMPVIATKLAGILEICEHNKNALLVDVKNTQQLIEAIKSLDNAKYHILQKNAQKMFKHFNSRIQTELFLKRINLIEERR